LQTTYRLPLFVTFKRITSIKPVLGTKNMDINKQQRAVVDALEDVKAQDIKVFNTTEITSLFDRVIIASATSNRQTRSLARNVEEKAKAVGMGVIATEGEETGEWVLVDLGDIVVHIMQPTIREYYNLEELWGEKPVRVKLGGTEASPAKRASSARKVSTKLAAPSKRSSPVKKTSPAKKTVTAKKTASKQATKIATKTTAKATTKTVKKTVAKAATKPAVKKAAVKK
jgi:ribosome-associated protein